MLFIRSIHRRGKEVKKRFEETDTFLKNLLQIHPTHTVDYLEAQWTRQREIQKETAKAKKKQMEVFLELEEDLIEARNELKDLNATTPRMRTDEERDDLLQLPHTIVMLEKKAQELANELGAEHFRKSAEGDQKVLLTIQLANSKLYEAKFGVVENQRSAQHHTGTTQQAWINQRRNRKKALLRKKYNTYHRHASKYNAGRRRKDKVPDPSFDEVESMPVTGPFWDIGSLSHPDEPWASCPDTREGIRVYHIWRGAQEELRRIARETRQLIRWALEYQVKIDDIRREYTLTEAKAKSIKLLYCPLVQRTSRLWMLWDDSLEDALCWTAQYFDDARDWDPQLLSH